MMLECLSSLPYVGSSCRGCFSKLDEEHHLDLDSCCGHHDNCLIIVGIRSIGGVQ